MPSWKTSIRCLAVLFLCCEFTYACDPLGWAFIEAIPGRSFTADVEITIWKTGGDGERTQVDHQIQRVARDKFGRVWHSDSGSHPLIGGIVDPISKSTIILQTGEGTKVVQDPVTGRPKVVTKVLNRVASVIQSNSFALCAPWPPDPPTVDFVKREPTGIRDVGWQTVSGIRLHGIRVAVSGPSPLSIEERLEEDYYDRYRPDPDDLRADRLVIYKFNDEIDARVELVNIRFDEPDPSLFRIPSNFKIGTQVEFWSELTDLRDAFEKSPTLTPAAPDLRK